MRNAGGEGCQRIGGVDHQGRRAPGDVYNPAVIMLANLRALFGCLVDIILLRRGPEHLPASAAAAGRRGARSTSCCTRLRIACFLAPLRPEMSASWALQIVAGRAHYAGCGSAWRSRS
mgnify:CR=1 FL=1